MEEYCESLVTTKRYVRNPSSDTNYHTFESEACKNSFSYQVNTYTNQIQIIFRYMEYIEDGNAKDLILDMGLPEIDALNYESHCKDITKFYEIQYNLKHELVLSLDLTFESVNKKEEFLDAYAELLTNDSYTYYDDPVQVKVPYKDHAFYNSEKRLIVTFNFDDSNMLSLHLIKVTNDFVPIT